MALSEDTKVHTEQNRFSANSDVAGPIGAFIKVCVQHQQEPHHPHVSHRQQPTEAPLAAQQGGCKATQAVAWRSK